MVIGDPCPHVRLYLDGHCDLEVAARERVIALIGARVLGEREEPPTDAS